MAKHFNRQGNSAYEYHAVSYSILLCVYNLSSHVYTRAKGVGWWFMKTSIFNFHLFIFFWGFPQHMYVMGLPWRLELRKVIFRLTGVHSLIAMNLYFSSIENGGSCYFQGTYCRKRILYLESSFVNKIDFFTHDR